MVMDTNLAQQDYKTEKMPGDRILQDYHFRGGWERSLCWGQLEVQEEGQWSQREVPEPGALGLQRQAMLRA